MKQFKTSFLLHDDSLEILEELSDEEAGRLFKAISKTHKAIVSEKTESVNSDNFGLNRLEWVLFKPFYNQLCRDYEAYKNTVETNRKNGEKGGRPRKEEPKKPNRFSENPKNPDKDSDKEKDSDSDKEKDKKTIVTASMEEADDVALHLANRILEYKSDAKVNPKAWAKDIELAIRIDGRSKDALIRCIDWMYHGGGSFWIPNIRSGKKLREQYDAMDMQARRPSHKKPDEMQERLAKMVHSGGNNDSY